MRARYSSILAILVALPVHLPHVARADDEDARTAAPPADRPLDESGLPASNPTTADVRTAEPAPDEGPKPDRPPPRGKGVVWGVVRSRRDGDTLLEATVSVVGRKDAAVTDVEGRYRLELPPGIYDLRIQYEFHRSARVKNVRVGGGRLTRLDVPLEPDDSAVEEMTAVEAPVERANAATQLLIRKNAVAASDAIGAQDIAKTPDRSAADAIRRVVGATVVDGKYVFIRGLGDRYTTTMLNGSPLPSPEPDRQAVPLDMFPTLVLSDLTISKTFTPDVPGDFAGGMLNIHTRDVPGKFLFQTTLGIGANTATTFRSRLTYRGGSLDWLGIDDGGRRSPSEVPARRLGSRDPNLTQIGRAMNGPMQSERTTSLPNGSGNMVIGDSWRLGGERVLGYVAGLSYTRRFQRRGVETVGQINRDPNNPANPSGLKVDNDYLGERGLDTVTWSGLGTVSYSFDRDNKISLTGLYSRNSEKESRILTGPNAEQATNVIDERLRFVNRQLTYTQLRGEHRIPASWNADLQWTALWSRAQLSDPNMRETVYTADGDNPYTFRDSTQSGLHFYAAQAETTKSASFDWTQPLSKKENAAKLKGGAYVSLRDRSFNARRFRFAPDFSWPDPTVFERAPGVLFSDANIGGPLKLQEWTNSADSYTAQYDVFAGYLMTDVPVTSRLRVVLGERVEASRQTVSSISQFSADGERVDTSLNRLDLLPSLNVIVKILDDANLRLSATRTVARPQLREMAPFLFTEYFGARDVIGNPNLDRTQITNLDARFEFFPRAGEVLAVSVFHKRFKNPIETVILPTGRGVITYENAKGAENTGVELEAQKSLDFIAKQLREFSFMGNLTLVHSRVELTGEVGFQTSNERPLAGQSPYVANVAIDWNHEETRTRVRALYNVFGPRVFQAGQNGVPDIYEQPRNLLDLSISQGLGEHFDLKATAENLLGAPVRFTQAEYLPIRYQPGTTVWVLGTYSY